MDSYDDELEDSEQADKWEEWFCNIAIKEILEYYRKNPDNDNDVYLKDEIPRDGEVGYFWIYLLF